MAEYRRANPYLIITAGATGSGKTRLMKETVALLGLDIRTVVKILVDDLVEFNEKYRKKVDSIMKRIEQLCEGSQEGKDECEKKAYENPSDELIESFGTAYFNVRDSPGCWADFPELNCNDINDLLLDKAVRERKNIVFEFTGSYIPSWLLDTSRIDHVYNIVLAYSFVNAVTLNKRNTARAYEAVQLYRLDRLKNAAPRLPNVSVENFSTVVIPKLRKALVQLYTECFLYHNPANCGNKRIDRLLLFDNNGGPDDFRLVFDSLVQGGLPVDDFMAIVDRSLHL